MENKNNLDHLKPRTSEDIQNEISQILSAINANENQRQQVLNVPPSYRLQFARALIMPDKRALAVKMKCYSCVGFESMRERIGNCGCRLCPLWLHRPFQDKNRLLSEVTALDPDEEMAE